MASEWEPSTVKFSIGNHQFLAQFIAEATDEVSDDGGLIMGWVALVEDASPVAGYAKSAPFTCPMFALFNVAETIADSLRDVDPTVKTLEEMKLTIPFDQISLEYLVKG